MACTSEKHSGHICELTAQGEIDLVHELAVDPTVKCGICGAKAKDKDRVCDIVLLPDIDYLGDGGDVKLDPPHVSSSDEPEKR